MKRELAHLNLTEQLAALIIDRLDCLGSQTPKRMLERSMSAHKRPLWRKLGRCLFGKNVSGSPPERDASKSSL
jgi:hypothetical protein